MKMNPLCDGKRSYVRTYDLLPYFIIIKLPVANSLETMVIIIRKYTKIVRIIPAPPMSCIPLGVF